MPFRAPPPRAREARTEAMRPTLPPFRISCQRRSVAGFLGRSAKSVREGAPPLVVGPRQAPAPMAEPYASGLADADRHRESRPRVERSGRQSADHRNELEDLPKAVSEGPPS